MMQPQTTPMPAQQAQPKGIVGSVGGPKNPQLRQVVEGIEAKVPTAMKDQYEKILVSGLELMSDPKTQKHVEELLETAADAPMEQRPTIYAHGVVKALAIVFNEGVSRGSAEAKQHYIDVAPLAGFTLMAHLLDFAEGATGERITPEFIDETAKGVASGFFSAFQIDPRKAQALFNDQQQGRPAAPPMSSQSVPGTTGAPSPAPMQGGPSMGGGIVHAKPI